MAAGRGGPGPGRRLPGRPAARVTKSVRVRAVPAGAGGYRAGVSMPRRTTLGARLARIGFADPAQAERLLCELALDVDAGDAELLEALGAAADLDLALAALARMPRDAELLAAAREDSGLRGRLAAVLGTSVALGDHLARHPEGWQLLRGPAPLACPTAG